MTARIVGSSVWGATASTTSDATSPIPAPLVNLPPFTVRDGLLLLSLNGWDGDAGTITAPASLTAITGITNGVHSAGTPTLACYSKVASSEGVDYEFSWTNSEWHQAVLLAFDGHDGIDIAAAADGTDAAPIAPTVTTTVPDCLIVRGFVCDVASSAIRPLAQNDGSLTLTSIFRATGSSSSGAGLFGGVHRQAAAGASGTFTFSTGASEQWRAFTIAIAPSGHRGGLSGIEVGL